MLQKTCSVLAGLTLLTSAVSAQSHNYVSGYDDYVLLVYEDTECPACAASHERILQAVEKINIPLERVVFPVTTGRLESEVEGIISHCVRTHIDVHTQSQLLRGLHKLHIDAAPAFIEMVAESSPRVEEHREALLECVQSPVEHAYLEDSIRMGIGYEVSGTPTFQLLNWETLGTGLVTGVPDTPEALVEWIQTTALMTQDVGQADAEEITAYLEKYPVMRRPFNEYKNSQIEIVETPITSTETRELLREIFKQDAQ